jgi:hypothetical protein
MLDRATNIGGHKAVLWWQGEGDAAIGTTRSTYESALNAIVNDWATRFPGKKWVIMNINAAGNAEGSGGTGASDTGFNAIHAALSNVAATNVNVSAIAEMNGLFAQLHYSTAPEIEAIANSAYNAIVGAYYAKHASITLVDATGAPRANLSGLKWAFFDQATPDTLLAPATNASGVFSAPLLNTSLAVGATGLLLVSDTNGAATQSPSSKAFCAPVLVS